MMSGTDKLQVSSVNTAEADALVLSDDPLHVRSYLTEDTQKPHQRCISAG